ncbi:MAG: DUF3892 domain-containing protein [Nitrososphaeraceae archaeon]
MGDYEITCIVHDYQGVITHVGLSGDYPKYSIPDIIRFMDNGHTFFTMRDYRRADVIAKQHHITGRQYLTTNPDDTRENNLDFLPQCM